MLGRLAKIPVPKGGAGVEGHADWNGGPLHRKPGTLETWNQIVTPVPPYLAPCKILEQCTTQRE